MASMIQIECKQCGGAMKKTSKTDRNYGVQAIGCAVFIVGLVLLFYFPIGTIIGICLMIGAGGMGYKKSKVWKCQQCGYFFERA